MAIETKETLLHWNYFLALEQDLEHVSRYIEFAESNFGTYSIELAHLLLASASEVDVIAKEICHLLQPGSSAGNIDNYRDIIIRGISTLPDEPVFVPRFGLDLHPWERWRRDRNPLWWHSYNDVKHHRKEHFNDANLKNVLNSMAGLLVVVFHYYRLEKGHDLTPHGLIATTQILQPESKLLRLSDNYYAVPMLWGA